MQIEGPNSLKHMLLVFNFACGNISEVGLCLMHNVLKTRASNFSYKKSDKEAQGKPGLRDNCEGLI